MKHKFAFYVPDISTGTVELTNESLCHRMAQVIRLGVGDECMLFNREVHTQVTITKIDKKTITVDIGKLIPNQTFNPPIHFFLPLLKRESLEAAVYGLTELGATEIHLTVTQKSLQNISEKQLQRLEKIIIAAAEQSKNFSFPLLKAPISFTDAIKQLPNKMVFFDPEGEPIERVLKQLDKNNDEPIGLWIGPEGDLTSQEKELLKEHNVKFSRLTPTVLRSFQAVLVGVGIIRSLMK